MELLIAVDQDALAAHLNNKHRPRGWRRCPLMVEIAIHYHCQTADFGAANGRFYAPAVQGCIETLVERGLLRRTGDTPPHIPMRPLYAKTPALKVWVDAITQVPFPERTEVWAIPAA